MARKLKSDKWLFGAAFFLVCVSVVMVYSALAGKAMDATSVPVQLMARQATWVLVGALLMVVVMRIDYRAWQQPTVINTAVGGVLAALLLLAVMKLLGAGHNVKGAVRWLGVGSIGIQPSEFAKLAVILFVARLLSQRMERINDLKSVVMPVGIGARRDGASHPLPARSRHHGLDLHRRVLDAVCRGPEPAVHRPVRAGRDAGTVRARVAGAVSARTRAGVPGSLGRPARQRLPDHPVAHRRRHRRPVGPRPDGRAAEAAVPARAAHRLHLRGDLRGDRLGWGARRARWRCSSSRGAAFASRPMPRIASARSWRSA